MIEIKLVIHQGQTGTDVKYEIVNELNVSESENHVSGYMLGNLIKALSELNCKKHAKNEGY
jgi:hypothetical protein